MNYIDTQTSVWLNRDSNIIINVFYIAMSCYYQLEMFVAIVVFVFSCTLFCNYYMENLLLTNEVKTWCFTLLSLFVQPIILTHIIYRCE